MLNMGYEVPRKKQHEEAVEHGLKYMDGGRIGETGS